MLTQKTFLSDLLAKNKNAIIIGSLGTISYDLKDIPHKNKILIKGAMGAVLGIGFGYALSTKKKVIVIVGDGSYMMKQGSVNTIMHYKPKNLKIYIMVNGKYASTGNQRISTLATLPPKSHFTMVRVA